MPKSNTENEIKKFSELEFYDFRTDPERALLALDDADAKNKFSKDQLIKLSDLSSKHATIILSDEDFADSVTVDDRLKIISRINNITKGPAKVEFNIFIFSNIEKCQLDRMSLLPLAARLINSWDYPNQLLADYYSELVANEIDSIEERPLDKIFEIASNIQKLLSHYRTHKN